MKVLGIDLGNAELEASSGVKFASRVKVGITKMNKDDIQVSYNKRNYTIGVEDGALNIGKSKYKKIHYKLCLLTAIAKSCKETNIDCKIVVGVPVENFNDKDLVENIKKEILSFKNEVIVVNEIEKIITIHDVEVFCEAGIVFSDKKRFKNEKTLVIDLGGSTVDISLWEGLRLSNSKTYKEGMITLYENIIKSVNLECTTDLKAYESKKMIGKSKYPINQEMTDITFINIDIDNYMTGLVSYINQYFEVDSCNSIQLIGGGAVMLEKWFKDEYERAELFPNAEFANAKTFKEIGEMVWI